MKTVIQAYKYVCICFILTLAGLCFAPTEFTVGSSVVAETATKVLPGLIVVACAIYAVLRAFRLLVVWSMPHSDLDA